MGRPREYAPIEYHPDGYRIIHLPDVAGGGLVRIYEPAGDEPEGAVTLDVYSLTTTVRPRPSEPAGLDVEISNEGETGRGSGLGQYLGGPRRVVVHDDLVYDETSESSLPG